MTETWRHTAGETAPRETEGHRHQRLRRWLYPYGLLLLILLAAAAARAYNLGSFSFWTDELYHVVAAESLLETGTPYLPGYTGGQYGRAYPVTYLAALGFRWFGNSETAGRAPFLVINLAFLLVVFYVTRRWFNVHLALIVVAVLAFSPHELRLGREVRMYGLFQLLYFTAAALVFEAMEHGKPGVRGYPTASWGRVGALPVRQISLLLGAGVLFLLAVWVQPLAVNLVVTLAAYAAVMAAVVWLRQGLREAAGSKYVLVLGSLGTLALGVAIAAPSVIDRLVALAKDRPEWASSMQASSFYSWFFLYYYPAFTFVYVLGALLLIRRYGKAAVFVVCSFVPLMLAHIGFFTGRVEERYIFYILPYFVIGACAALGMALRSAFELVISEWRARSRVVALLVGLSVLPAANLFAHTWLRESRDMLRWGYGPNWKSVVRSLRGLKEECVTVSPWPLHVAYYSGEFPDYILRKRQPEDGEGPVGRLGSRVVPVRWLSEADELERLVGEHDDICVIATDWALDNDAYVDEAMHLAIQRLLVPEPHYGDGKVAIYRTKK